VPAPRQLAVNAVNTVPALILLVDLRDESSQLLVAGRPCRRRAFLPRVKSLPGYLQHLAHERDRESFLAWLALVRLAHLGDERELY
jgi:hypothetical protein